MDHNDKAIPDVDDLTVEDRQRLSEIAIDGEHVDHDEIHELRAHVRRLTADNERLRGMLLRAAARLYLSVAYPDKKELHIEEATLTDTIIAELAPASDPGCPPQRIEGG